MTPRAFRPYTCEGGLFSLDSNGSTAGASGLEVLKVAAEGTQAEAPAVTDTAPHDVADDWTTEPGPPYRGVIAIEWPAATGGSVYACLLGWGVKVTDAATGKPVTTCLDVTVHADAGALVTADLTLLADEDGEPLLEGKPVVRDGEPLTGTFPFVVAEMKVRHA